MNEINRRDVARYVSTNKNQATMNPNEFSRHLRRMNDEVRRAVNSDIPKKVAAKAVTTDIPSY